MSDSINVGNISNSEAVAIGHGATASVTHHHYTPPKFPLDNLPPPNLAFTGRREELAAIVSNFAATANTPVVLTQAIAGLGGVGKTQLALAYAHAHRDEYDLIWQLRANDTLTLDTDLRQLGMTLNLPIQDKDTPTARRMVLSWLNGSEQRWLLLFDNADQIKPRDLRPYLPSGGGHLLITSRRATAQWQRMAHTLTLDVFTALEAAAFWQKRGLKPEPTLADLAEALGHLPLAMELAAAHMTTRKTSAANYLTQFQERRRELWAREEPPDDYHATIMTTWQMAFDHARQTAGAAALLNLCCFLAPDDIPLDIIQEQVQTLPNELAAVMADDLALADALTALQNYSLITHAGGLLNLHRLVQSVARERMGAERAKEWVQVTVNLLAKAYNFDLYDMSTWVRSGQLLPHVTTAANLAVEWEVNSEQAAYLNNEAGVYLRQYGEYTTALPLYEQSLFIREKLLGLDHLDTAESHTNLGDLLTLMGEYAKARPFLERALIINEKQLGSDHPDTATSLNNLGALLHTMGEYEEARPFFKRALIIDEKTLGSDHPRTAQDLNNLGALLRAIGEYGEARSFFERSLAIREEQLGSDHPQTAESLTNLGALLRVMEKYGEARSFLERALAIKENQLGFNHPSTATTLNNLGLLLHDMGELEASHPCLERALDIYENTLGKDHPSTATALNNLGELLQAMGKYEAAWPYKERALQIDEKTFGSDHPSVAIDLNSLGVLLQEMGKHREARPFYERALFIREEQFDLDNPKIAQSLNNLAVLSAYEGDMVEAAQLMHRALAIWGKVLGNDHPQTQAARRSLSSMEAELSRKRWRFGKRR